MRADFPPGPNHSVLVIGAGLSGLAAAETLLDAGQRVTIVDSFPVAGGRVASFDVSEPVAGLVPGDVVEHGLHGFFQHYHALYGLMERAGLRRPEFAGRGSHFWHPRHGHFTIPGGQLVWLLRALMLPEAIRGPRAQALGAFAKLIAYLPRAEADPTTTDRMTAAAVLSEFGVPRAAVDNVFRPCLFSLTSLPLEQLSALEMLRWLSRILPDPRIRGLAGGGSAALASPILRRLVERGADARLGVEVTQLRLDEHGCPRVTFETAPDRTGVRHVLVPGFRPGELPSLRFDAVLSTLPPDRLRAVLGSELTRPTHRTLAEALGALENVHPLSVRLWFERPLVGVTSDYVLCSGTVFDVLRPTPEPERYAGIHLVDLLIDNMASHVPDVPYDGEQYLAGGPGAEYVMRRVLSDLERVYPGQIRSNRVARRFLHTREGIVAARPGMWSKRPPQHLGHARFVVAGDWTRQPWGVCMEGAVRSGQLAARSLLAGRQLAPDSTPFAEVSYRARELVAAARQPWAALR